MQICLHWPRTVKTEKKITKRTIVDREGLHTANNIEKKTNTLCILASDKRQAGKQTRQFLFWHIFS